jgi:hypothetical protein
MLLCRCNINSSFVEALICCLPQFKLLDLSSSLWDITLDVSTALSNNSGSRFLQALRVEGMSLTQHDVLGAFTGPTSLSLVDVTVRDTDSLLAALPQLRQLQDLTFKGWHGQRFTVAQLRDALAPLTQLTALGLSDTKYVDNPAAVELQLTAQQSPGAGRQPAVGGLFPGLRLPRLQVLDANKLCWTKGGPRAHRPLCGTGDLRDIIAAMPVISCLRVKGSMGTGSTLGTLTDLEAVDALAGSLTCLEMSAEQGLQDGHLQSLKHLSGLRSLVVAEVGALITDQGILGLSALSALSRLELTGVMSRSVSMELLPGRGSHAAMEFKLQNKYDQVGVGCCRTSCAIGISAVFAVLHTDLACGLQGPHGSWWHDVSPASAMRCVGMFGTW